MAKYGGLHLEQQSRGVVVPLFPANTSSSQEGNATGGSSTGNETSKAIFKQSSMKAGRFEGKLVEGNFTSSDFVGLLQGKMMVDFQADMLNGFAYANVHSLRKQAGEIRGQVDLKNTTCSMETHVSQGGSNSSGAHNSTSSANSSIPGY